MRTYLFPFTSTKLSCSQNRCKTVQNVTPSDTSQIQRLYHSTRTRTRAAGKDTSQLTAFRGCIFVGTTMLSSDLLLVLFLDITGTGLEAIACWLSESDRYITSNCHRLTSKRKKRSAAVSPQITLPSYRAYGLKFAHER